MYPKRTHLVQCLILLAVLVVSSACQPETPTPLPEPPMDTSPPPGPTTTSPAAATPLPPTETAHEPTAEAVAPSPLPPPEAPGPMQVGSTAFDPDGMIPEKYTCFGDNISPGLEWSSIPPEAHSLALLVYDLDAGAGMGASTPLGFAHWIVYNIPASTAGLPEGILAGESMEDGARQGTNDFAQFQQQGASFPGGAPVKLVGYDGPCPPSGAHSYAFALYALDSSLDLPPGEVLSQVLEAIEGHTLSQAELIGTYTPSQ